MAEQFSKGDLVRLKSGGPLMTVVYVDNDGETQIGCVWFRNGEECRGSYPPETLENSVKASIT